MLWWRQTEEILTYLRMGTTATPRFLNLIHLFPAINSLIIPSLFHPFLSPPHLLQSSVKISALFLHQKRRLFLWLHRPCWNNLPGQALSFTMSEKNSQFRGSLAQPQSFKPELRKYFPATALCKDNGVKDLRSGDRRKEAWISDTDESVNFSFFICLIGNCEVEIKSRLSNTYWHKSSHRAH